MNAKEAALFLKLGETNLETDTASILEAVNTPKVTRRYIAGLYGIAIRYDFGQTDWKQVNEAIIARWSLSGLKWIKRLAWSAVENAG